jgi:hypothetical protein
LEVLVKMQSPSDPAHKVQNRNIWGRTKIFAMLEIGGFSGLEEAWL